MDTLSIRIKIGDREYPMKVKADEEARIRRVGKLINDKIKKYREEFGLEDRQDLLAMVSFDCMVESMELNETQSNESEQIKNVVSQVNQRLDALL
ncbi:cell division protein ZapA [Cyclobacterium jeungdonense]|uniref:Cell division protein ZapA n=1 Tax=Cyclobacterium jeungdonense TaxID=708087 RepID=A0ABT8C3J8_9BACT|nr:cell division protein ZapA [Cyclobacterium jeungdonense]MDN3686662.1 cell division protein ZapA [Cyclobacterium jeungdonense]